jgi:hypothetical protein
MSSSDRFAITTICDWKAISDIVLNHQQDLRFSNALDLQSQIQNRKSKIPKIRLGSFLSVCPAGLLADICE